MRNYTGYGWQGTKYKEGMLRKDVAKLIRAQLKREFPGFKFSVRTKEFAGGGSIDITIMTLPYNPINPSWNGSFRDPNNQLYTEQYLELVKKIERVINQYRRNDSDGMIDYFDTNFYSEVQLDWELQKALREDLS